MIDEKKEIISDLNAMQEIANTAEDKYLKKLMQESIDNLRVGIKKAYNKEISVNVKRKINRAKNKAARKARKKNR